MQDHLFLFLFFENETYIAKQSRGYKWKPANQEREAYQIVHKDLKKGGNPFPQVGRAIPTGKLCQFVCCRIK